MGWRLHGLRSLGAGWLPGGPRECRRPQGGAQMVWVSLLELGPI